MMEKQIKTLLLRYGGYRTASRVHDHLENLKLKERIRSFRSKGRLPLPDGIMFEPTQQCNLRCRMCYQNRQALTETDELDGREIKRFFDQNPSFGKVTLYGGEIFMREDILDIIRSLGPDRNVILTTNGTLIGDDRAEDLKGLPFISTVCVSLDGPAEVHDLIRGQKGCFEKAIRSLRSLAPSIPVTVTTVIQNDNIEVLPEVIDLCSSLKVLKIKYEMERLYGEERMNRTIREAGLQGGDTAVLMKGRSRKYSLSRLNDVLKECLRRGEKRGIYVTFDPPYLMKELENCYSNNLRRDFRCLCRGFGMGAVAPNGDVIHCYVIRKAFGNIRERSFAEIWNSDEASRFRYSLIEQNLTPICENCGFMVLGSRRESGPSV